ncbi:NADH-quinone oxidoreductase subunit N [Wohlfahrtiimonas chitiniclastica]|uniref:NADH-quinone oxidoreductase subunit N n=1 Tax=Wohlfahrtiimonas chitiniclastica TaxID=400946 RepID=UPI001BD03480|nr:NADH-quinone oxidoreductase subunit N [Wohlfahrtiimonas chitiniclastica]MBS7828975.1 NADH-quinone oxidoreductase subunit N [Wohlfahrtiimonas chitiniclastica]MBS7836831.1 NADH-quinone oxidoreductase subunit N [Wohlfahrtiimonas chitiniclastica]
MSVLTSMDFIAILPEIILTVAVVGILLLECISKQSRIMTIHLVSMVAILAAFVVLLTVVPTGTEPLYFWNSEIVLTGINGQLKSAMLLVVLLGLIYSFPKLSETNLDHAEYYVLILLSTIGMLVLVSANTLLMVYLGLELMSLPMYALVAFNRKDGKATEAAMKYFVMGAMASAILLFGMALLYGVGQSLNLQVIGQAISSIASQNFDQSIMLLTFSLVFIVVGIAFKLGVAPFHAWVPDVYEGAPAPVAMFIGAAPKIAAMAMGYSMLMVAGYQVTEQWQQMLAIVIILSFVIGNFVALRQTNLRRMLGYSAVSHAGFMLLGLYAGNDLNIPATGYFYAITYAFTTIAAFGFILLVNKNGQSISEISDLKGFGRQHGYLGVLMALIMLSMGGIPPFVGFVAKFFVLENAYQSGYGFLVIIGLLASVVGLFYYLRVIKVMFFDQADDNANITITPCYGSQVIFSANVFLLVLLGFVPTLLI